MENLVSTDKQRLTEDDDDDQGLCSPSRPNSIILWSVLAFLAVLIIVGIIVGVVYGVTRSGQPWIHGKLAKSFIILVLHS